MPSTTDTRSFSIKRNRFSAAHIRKLIATGDLNHVSALRNSGNENSKRLTGNDVNGSNNKLILTNLPDPLDVEDILSNSTVTQPTADLSTSSILFPPIDLEIYNQDVVGVTSPSQIIPEHIDPYTIEPHILEACHRHGYKTSFTISRKHHSNSSAFAQAKAAITRNKILERVPKQKLDEIQGTLNEINLGNVKFDVSNEERDSFCSMSSDSSSVLSTNKDDSLTTVSNTISSASQTSLVKDQVYASLIKRSTPENLQLENTSKRNNSRISHIVSILPTEANNKNDNNIEKRIIPQYNNTLLPNRTFVMLKVQELSLEPSDLEPIFGSIVLFDLKEKRRLSETFYFDFNVAHLYTMIHQSIFQSNLTPKAGLFELFSPEKLVDIFIIIKLEKVLQAGESNDIYEPYIKFDTNSSVKEKYQNLVIANCKRLGNFRMPFAWSAIELSQVLSGGKIETLNRRELSNKDSPYLSSANDEFDITIGSSPLNCNDFSYIGETESIHSMDRTTIVISPSPIGSLQKKKYFSISTVDTTMSPPPTPVKYNEQQETMSKKSSIQTIFNKPFTIKLHSFIRSESDKLSDEELIKCLLENKKNSNKTSKLKTIGVKFCIELTILPKDWNHLDETNAFLINNCISSELKKWKNCIVPMFNNFSKHPMLREVLSFPFKGHYEVNDDKTMRNLLFIYPKSANFSNRSGNARNICIKVQLMDNNETPLKVFYNKNSSELVDYVYTSVSYHNKTPQFGDEIKANIPIDLNDGHHLLFTFYHISCKLTSKNSEVPETPIGYTWIPIYQERGCLQTGYFNIPISLDILPKGYCYLTPEVNLPNIKWLESHKPLFQVQISAITSIHTQDKYLDAFFRAYNSLKTIKGCEVISAVNNLAKAQPEPLVAFFYSIIDKLLSLITYARIDEKFIECKLSEACFTTLSQLIKICTVLLDGSVLDNHGRSSLLAKYIHLNKVTPKYPDMNNVNMYSHNKSSAMSSDSTVDELHKIIHEVEIASCSMKISSTESEGNKKYKFLHEEIVYQWILSTGFIKDNSCTYSWFFLELIIKSMSEFLLSLNSQMLYVSRRSRFGDEYHNNLSRLISILTNEIVERASKDLVQASCINNSLAFFLQDAFSIMDRTFIMRLVKSYYKDISSKIANISETLAKNLMILRLDFTKILLSYEHVIALNLPISENYLSNYYNSTNQNILSETFSSKLLLEGKNSKFPVEISTSFKAQHFLIGVLLSDLVTSLHSGNEKIQSKAILNVKNLLVNHENDYRICENQKLMEKVADLYFPLLGVCVDNSNMFFSNFPLDDTTSNSYIDLNSDGRTTLDMEQSMNLLSCFCWVLKFSNNNKIKNWIISLPSERLENFVAVLYAVVTTFEFKRQARYIKKMYNLSKLCEGIKNYSPSCGDSFATLPRKKNSSNQCSPSKAMTVSAATILSGSGYKTASSSKTQATNLTNSAILESSIEVKWRNTLRSGVPSTQTKSIVSVKTQNTTQSTDSLNIVSMVNSEQSQLVLAYYLTNEIYLTVLDTIEMMISLVSRDESSSTNIHFVLSSILRSLLHLVSSSTFSLSLENIFATQRLAVLLFPDFYFSQQSELCQDLCLQLLKHLASKSSVIRSHAAASMYMLMANSYESMHSFSRLKMQITMALSTLVSNCAAYGIWTIHETDLKKSLSNLLSYLECDLTTNTTDNKTLLSSTSFPPQVKDLIFNLHMILSDTAKLKHHSDDFELLMDLMFRIAKGYQNNPDLRLTWLLSMAGKNIEHNNISEAAQCLLHCAALITEYLSMLSPDELFTRGAALFSKLSDNILDESAISDDVISPEEEGICESSYFSVEGLIFIIEQAAILIEKDQMYELAIQLYNILISLIEEYDDRKKTIMVYEKVSQMHKKLEEIEVVKENISDAWLSPLANSDKRHFGTFFRVGFYGDMFGEELDGSEYIYREPSLTQLSEISHRLEGHYIKRFGAGCVEIIKDSNEVDKSKLNLTSKVYLQITFVEPYFDGWEKKERINSMFHRRYNVKRFVYATPFTKDGRSHGELKDQYKRKTILTTSKSFPYVKSRIKVIKKEQIILIPIEAAIEDIQKKTRELHAATVSNPVDPKILQMVLQGCIGTTVNQGPIQMAKVFLSNMYSVECSPIKNNYQTINILQNKLRLCYKDFSMKCRDALKKNEQLISPEQVNYQNELRKNYIEFTTQLGEILKVSCIPIAQTEDYTYFV
ncbi:LD20667p [Strongyloides ratti]|uniref:LD20667p n=1 Tax=Strongyloides ratti TaxID=34506 RepID=A0A090L8V8_STRRB|nr:LD20667p [Strongyloides ratti]CEF63950.1 LD20667p [Strongyloides ratti]